VCSAFEEARTLAQAVPGFFCRNHDYGVEYQERVRCVIDNKKRKKKTNVDNREGETLFVEDSIAQSIELENTPRIRRRHKHYRPTSRDLEKRFKDHTVDYHNSDRMMHDHQSDDDMYPNDFSSHIAI